MTYVTLPQSLVIDDCVHIQHWRSQHYAVYQNYSAAVSTTNNPYPPRQVQQVAGRSMFHLFQVEHVGGGEQLGAKLGSYNNLNAAMDAAEQVT